MDQDFKKIETMDDIRALMNDPEIKAANKEISKKYLKANRPKSIMVVIISLAALCGIISLSQLKAASVTPPAFRTAEEISVVWQDETLAGEPVALTEQQHQALIELLSDTPVDRVLEEETEASVTPPALEVLADETLFCISREGVFVVDDSIYTVSDAEGLWTELETLLK